jgi:hypothetical protein
MGLLVQLIYKTLEDIIGNTLTQYCHGKYRSHIGSEIAKSLSTYLHTK